MVQSIVKISMKEDNDLDCSYAIVSKGTISILLVFKELECAIIDYDSLKRDNYAYRYLLLKHYNSESYAYTDFLKLIGKMCKKREDSKYFLNHKKEDNRMVCSYSEKEHMIREDEKKIYEERYRTFEEFVMKNRLSF